MPRDPIPPILVTCEHAGREVPEEWDGLFRDRDDLLASHRGWDLGARDVARAAAERLDAPLRLHSVTRLLVDINRSPDHPDLFGSESGRLSEAQKERILERWYRPYRERVEVELAEMIERRGRAVHVGIHTFTPVLDGRRRETGIGLLYDPARDEERRLVEAWQRHLRRALPELRVHRNRPYRGTSDGFTTALRKRFEAATYQGIEVEVRNELVRAPGSEAERIGRVLGEGLLEALDAG